MPETPTVAWARQLVAPLLAPLGDRWAHVRAVAVRAEDLVPAVEVAADRDLLVAAAWLHDVGYAPGARRTGCHQVDGAEYLERHGVDGRLCALVAHHSAAEFEVAQRGLSPELHRWHREESAVADALWLPRLPRHAACPARPPNVDGTDGRVTGALSHGNRGASSSIQPVSVAARSRLRSSSSRAIR